MTRPTLPRRIALARRPRGVTCVEAAVVLAVIAVLLGTALPSFEQTRQRRHLEGVALQFETDVQHARSLAVARNQTVRIGFFGGDAASCYVVHTGNAGACTCGAQGAVTCGGSGSVLRAVHVGGHGAPTLKANVKAMTIDPTYGTVTPTASVRVRIADGTELRQIVNVMGRTRSCTPAPGLPGYPLC